MFFNSLSQKVELSSQNIFLAKYISQPRPTETNLQMTPDHNSDGKVSIERKQVKSHS